MITFYSRPNCRLCEEGMSLLKLVQETKGFTIEEINIEEDDDLHERYLMQIPVVMQNGKIIQAGLLDYVTLLDEIE
ncbi:MAG: glutaredoxin family protein [Kurthia sp.]|nr:glutaredoxin family protein [Candidatus Kurthia equi]